MINCVSGESLGLDKSVFAFDDGVKIRKFRMRGRWLYCKKNIRKNEIGGIVVPDLVRAKNTYMTVLAVGVGCGKYEPKTIRYKKAAGYRKGINVIFNVFDKVFVPDDNLWGLYRSPLAFNWEDFFIHECIPIFKTEVSA